MSKLKKQNDASIQIHSHYMDAAREAQRHVTLSLLSFCHGMHQAPRSRHCLHELCHASHLLFLLHEAIEAMPAPAAPSSQTNLQLDSPSSPCSLHTLRNLAVCEVGSTERKQPLEKKQPLATATPAFLRTHPLTNERVQRVKDALPQGHHRPAENLPPWNSKSLNEL
eukprot:1162083-Pelagomonas_calceolata.AAC.13